MTTLLILLPIFVVIPIVIWSVIVDIRFLIGELAHLVKELLESKGINK